MNQIPAEPMSVTPHAFCTKRADDVKKCPFHCEPVHPNLAISPAYNLSQVPIHLKLSSNIMSLFASLKLTSLSSFPFSFLDSLSPNPINMAHNTSNRHILAVPEHKPKTSISMDPTLKKQPKPTPSSTIDNMSNKFSHLYANQKILKSNSKDSYGHSSNSLYNHLKTKSWTDSHVLDSSCTALTELNSQHGSSTMVKVKKYVPHKGKEFDKEVDVKRAFVNLSKSQEFERFKGFDEIKKQSLSVPLLKNGGRRKSFCSSKIELADFFSCSGVKVVAVDMPPFMQIHAVNCARKTHDSLEKFTSKALALTLKKEFDGVYGPAWHCIVGSSFGSFVTHSVGGFMYFSMDRKIYVLLFKTTIQKAESS